MSEAEVVQGLKGQKLDWGEGDVLLGVDLGTMRHGAVCCIKEGSVWRVWRSWMTHRFGELWANVVQAVRELAPQRLFLIVEVPQPYGVSPSSIFLTSANIGAFLAFCLHTFSEFPLHFVPIPRPFVKLMLLGTVKGKDKDIRDCLKRVWEGRYDRRYLKGDAWAALAVVEAFLRGGVPQYDLVQEWLRLFEEWKGKESQAGKELTDDEVALLNLLRKEGTDDDD